MAERETGLMDIPHRPPFLFVDEVVEFNEKRIVTRTKVNPDWECFRGHYPGNPVMPGVLLCECCFQSGAILLLRQPRDSAMNGAVPVLTRIGDARFKNIVRPSETLMAEVTLDDTIDNAYAMTARMTSAEKQVLRVQFTCMLLVEGTS